MSRHSIATTVLAAILAVPGCEPRVEIPPPGATYNIVAVLPMTGRFAAKGRDHREAIEMAVNDLEAAGGVGKPIRILLVDAGEDSMRARTLLEEALETLRDGTGTLHLAAIVSSTTAALKGSAPLALELGIPHLEVSSGSGLDEVPLADGVDPTLALATRPLCMPEPELTAEFLAGQANAPVDAEQWQDLVIVRGTDEHDEMHANHVRMHLPMHGWPGMVPDESEILKIDGNDYETALAKIMAQDPDVLYYHLNGDQRNLDFLEAARLAGYEGKIVTCGMARNDILLDPVDPGIAGYLAGRLYFMMRGPIEGDRLDAFRADFEVYTGRAIDTFAPSAYDAVMLVGLALAATGGATGPELRDGIRDVARGGEVVEYGDARALELARAGVDIDYQGASGTLEFGAATAMGSEVPGRFYVETIEEAPPEAGRPYRYRAMEPDRVLPAETAP